MALQPYSGDYDPISEDQQPRPRRLLPYSGEYEPLQGVETTKGVSGHARDAGLSLLKGVISVPEAAVGLADIPAGGRIGKFLENEGGTIGFRPGEAKDILSELHTEQYKEQQQQFQDADGIWGKTKTAIQNPSLIANTVIESLPGMGAGGAAARGVLGATRLGNAGRAVGAAKDSATPAMRAAATRNAVAAGAVGEGAVMAGMQASEIRGQTDDGLITPEQSGYAAATGALGGLFGFAGGRLAQKLGIGDVDTMLARGVTPEQVAAELASTSAKSIPRQVIEGAITEGFLEELPQSVSETILQNLALDRDWADGVDDAIVMGTLAGMTMGGGAAGVAGVARKQVLPTPTPENPNPAPIDAPDPNNGPLSRAVNTLADTQQVAPVLDTGALERQGVTPPPVLDTGALDYNLGQAPAVVQPPPQPELTPEQLAQSAWDSMNAFERGKAARGAVGSVSDVVGKPWSSLSVEQQQALTEPVNTVQAGRWADPNQKARDHEGPVLQNRDRTSQESVNQMRDIAKNPDYNRLKTSGFLSDGAPVVISENIQVPEAQLGVTDTASAGNERFSVQYAVVEADQLMTSNNIEGVTNPAYETGEQGKARAIAGNGRVTGLQSAWANGNASQYKADMANDAMHGIDRSVIESMKNPVLVRLLPQDQVTDNIGDLSNRDEKGRLSVVEQAKTDMGRIDLDSLQFTEQGAIGGEAVRKFSAAQPAAERVSPAEARKRLESAVFQKAYGNDELTEIQAGESEDAKTIMSALAQAAPSMSKLEGAGEFDIRPLITQAGIAAVNSARRGIKLSEYVNQAEMGMDPLVYPILEMMLNEQGNIRSSKYIGEQLTSMARLAYDEANAPGTDMFGEKPKRTGEQIIRDALTGVQGYGQINDGRGQESLGQRGRSEPDAQMAEGPEGGRERPADAGQPAQAEQPTEVEQARPVEIQRTEDGKSIRVYGDRAEVRSQLRAAGIRLPGAEIDGGLSFAARLETQIRDALGVQEQVEEELTGHADDVLVDDGRELEPVEQEQPDDKWRSNYMQAMQKARDIGLDTDPLKDQGLKALVDAIDARERGGQQQAAQYEPSKISTDTLNSWTRQGMKAGAASGWTVFVDHITDGYILGRKVKEKNQAGGGYVSAEAVSGFATMEEAKAWAKEHISRKQDFNLQTQTEEQRAQQEAEIKAAAEAEAKAKRKADEAERKRKEQEADKARADETVDSFELGQSSDEAMSGMGDIFDTSPEEVGLADTAGEQPSTDGAPTVTAPIEDAGEKLGGARKDELRTVRERLDDMSDEAIASSRLSELWPKGEADRITGPFHAAAYHAVRAYIPTKPRATYRVKRWVDQVKAARGLLQDLADIGADASVAKMRETSPSLNILADQIELLMGIDRAHWSRVSDAKIRNGRYSQDGEMVPGSWVELKIDKRSKSFYGHDSIASALPAINQSLDSKPVAEKRQKFSIYTRTATGEVFISADADRERRALKSFENTGEARKYLDDHHGDLVAAWEAVKNRESVTKSDMRRSVNEARVGQDYRGGKDVTPEQFLDQFGFRGVEFGNWVKQGKGGQERQGMLNDAYDAFMDLASTLNVPPKALSLEGRLGIGFGSRGRGRANAHFESDRGVINLTKTKGAGALAHEWFHAMDNYFAHKRGVDAFTGDNDAYRKGAFVTYRPEPMMVRKDTVGKRYRLALTRAELALRRARSPDDPQLAADAWVTDPEHKQGVRPVVEKAFAELVQTLDASPMTRRSSIIDKGKVDGYWSQIIERGARAFETYVIARLADQGARNDYLANVQTLEEFSRDPGRYPYLTPDEQGPVNEAFDKLFSTIETQQTDSGDVVMFSFAGRRSGTAMHKKLDKAIRQTAMGINPEQVRQDTGWHRGVDGKWRYEISDADANLKVSGKDAGELLDMAALDAFSGNRKHATVADLLVHSKLFEAYPQLASIPVRKMKNPRPTAVASVQVMGNEFVISLNPSVRSGYVASALLHELQHGIQIIEGFARGGNSRMSAMLANLSVGEKAATNAYLRLAGEIEARNTQARMSMNDEFRKLLPPAETQDVTDAEAIVTFDGTEMQDFTHRDPITRDELKVAFDRDYPKLSKALGRMLERGDRKESGGLVILESSDPLKIARKFSQITGRNLSDAIRMFDGANDAQGFYDPRTGLTFLVGPSVTEANAAAVVLHEAVHGQQNKRLDQAAVQMLVNRKQEGDKNTRDFLDRVVRRMARAEGGVVEQEAAAYIVEQAILEGRDTGGHSAIDGKLMTWIESNLGKTIADLVRDFVKAYRQFALRHELPLKVTIDDMVDYAQASMKQSAKKGASSTQGRVRQSQGDTEASAQAEGQRQFEAAEKAAGGRAAYDKAKAAGKTKLNYRQWVQVRTPAFKQWFGDWENDPANASKVVDAETGEPMVVYHGTRSDFNTFKETEVGRNFDDEAGFFFTSSTAHDTVSTAAEVRVFEDEASAGAYAKNDRSGGAPSIMPAFLNLRNPEAITGDSDGGGVLSLIETATKGAGSAVANAGRRGMDGLMVTDTYSGSAQRDVMLAVLSPNQIKSAIGNVGTFSGATDDIRFSRIGDAISAGANRAAAAVDRLTNRKREIPSSWTPEQKAAAAKFDTFTPRQPATDRLNEIKSIAASKIVQKVFDQFRPLRNLSETGFMQAHLSKGTSGAVQATLEMGTPVLKDGAISLDTSTGGILKAMTDKLGSMEEIRKFLMWRTAQRAENLMAQGRENLFTTDDITAMKAFAAGQLESGTSRAGVYRQVNAELTRVNNSILDIAEQAGLVDAESRKEWQDDFYIPFYRVMENEDGTHSSQYSFADNRLARQEVIRRLEGGEQNLGDPLENLVGNWSTMLSASMRNMASSNALNAGEQQGIARRITKQEFAKGERGDTWVLENGQRAHYEVADPMVLEALESLNFNGYRNPVMNAAGAFKRALTFGVTISPTFRVRNLIRDTLQSMAVAEVGYNPVRNMVDGFKMSAKDTETMAQLTAGGGAITFSTEGNPNKDVERLLKHGVATESILDTPKKLSAFFAKAFNAYQRYGDQAETVNRAVIYDQEMAASGDHLKASFAARDLMNFTSMGSSAAIRALAQVLPFFNARLQGMDRLARGGKGNPQRFSAVAGTVAMASALLYLIQGDDEEYKALPDYVRDTYWPVKIGGNWVYIPKPFEIGALATVVERMTELAVAGDDYQVKDFRDTLVSVIGENLSMNPIPQIIKPVGEAWFNYDMFRGQSIDSMAMQRLLPGDRYNAHTTAGAVVAGQALNISPQRLEHMVRGYFGWLGVQALNVGDLLGRTVMDLPESTRRDYGTINNWFVVGDFVKMAGTTPSKYVSRFYDMQRDINQIYATANAARKSGDMDRYQELMSDPKMRARPALVSASRQMTQVNQQIRAINASRSLSAADKNQRIRALNLRRERIAQRIDALARQG